MFNKTSIIILSIIAISIFLNWRTIVTDNYPLPSKDSYWQIGLITFEGVLSIITTLILIAFFILGSKNEFFKTNSLTIIICYGLFNLLMASLLYFNLDNNRTMWGSQKYYPGNGLHIFTISTFILVVLCLFEGNKRKS